MDEHLKLKLSEIVELHNDYSAALKKVEQHIHSFDLTTLNDARYALRGIVDCIESIITSNNKKFDDAFGIAMTALRIAWHDVVDITVDEFKLYLDELGQRYDCDIVASIIPIKQCKESIYKIEDLITESRGDRSKRIELYRNITANDLDTMLNLYRQCKDLEPSIALKYKKEKSNKFLVKFGLSLAGISLCVLTYVNFIKV